MTRRTTTDAPRLLTKDHGASQDVFTRQWLVSDEDGGSCRLGAPAENKTVGSRDSHDVQSSCRIVM